MPEKCSSISTSLTDPKDFREAIRERLCKARRAQVLVPPNPPPRYDEIFALGQEWLDQLDVA